MALFKTDTKKKTVKKATKASKADAPAAVKSSNDDGRYSEVLRAPWMSEKALIGTEKGVYVFAIAKTANKQDVAKAIELTYKVKPVKVRIVNLPAKTVSLRTRRGIGTRARRHKAYVYLKKGDTIQF